MQGESRPIVSVFTAAHRTGAAIAIPWRSIGVQTYPYWEWVIAVDSRDDDTASRVAQLAASGPNGDRVRCCFYTADGSIGAAKAAAANACHGDIVVELDHDDELLPDALEAVA